VIASVWLATMILTSVEMSSVERLAWLAGCWELRGEKRIVEERWMPPRGGTMHGMGRTVAGGRTVDWEWLRIEERDGRLVFVALPARQAETEFVQVALGDSVVTFENPEHDFPRRISYRREPDGSIVARIEGGEGESLRAVDFPLQHADCE